MDRRRITEQRIISWPDEDLTLELDVPEILLPRLAPRLQRRQDIEWLGIIRRAKGGPGALGRLKATGALVEVFGRSVCVARPRFTAAFSTALEEELRRLLHDADSDDSQAGARIDPS